MDSEINGVEPPNPASFCAYLYQHHCRYKLIENSIAFQNIHGGRCAPVHKGNFLYESILPQQINAEQINYMCICFRKFHTVLNCRIPLIHKFQQLWQMLLGSTVPLPKVKNHQQRFVHRYESESNNNFIQLRTSFPRAKGNHNL